MLDKITPVILTLNEAANIRRTLSALTWAKRIVVVDSFSNDATEQICAEFSNVEFIQRAFDQHAKQWNFAIKQNLSSEWTLALDADHVLSAALIDELSALNPAESTQGYWASFRYLINGRALKQSLYPPLISLFRTAAGHYIQDGHTQRLALIGEVASLDAKIQHDDRKSNRRWLRSQWIYAAQEADKLAHSNWSQLSLPDRLRKTCLAPLAVLPYTLLAQGLIINGWPGMVYSLQRFVAEIFLQLARLRRLLNGAKRIN